MNSSRVRKGNPDDIIWIFIWKCFVCCLSRISIVLLQYPNWNPWLSCLHPTWAPGRPPWSPNQTKQSRGYHYIESRMWDTKLALISEWTSQTITSIIQATLTASFLNMRISLMIHVSISKTTKYKSLCMYTYKICYNSWVIQFKRRQFTWTKPQTCL